MSRMNNTTGWMIALLVGFGLLAAGCGDISTFEGEKNAINYQSPTGFWGNTSPELAVGARLKFLGRKNIEGVTDPEDGPEVEFTEVTSEDPEVVTVAESMGTEFILEAKKAGTVTIETKGRADGETVSDSFEIEAAEVKKVEFESTCPEAQLLAEDGEQAENPFLAGSTIRLEMKMYGDDTSTRLAGYGYNPASLSGVDATLDTSAMESSELVVNVGAETGTLVVESDVTDDRLEFPIISVEELDEVIWGEMAYQEKIVGDDQNGGEGGNDEVDDVLFRLRVGETSYIHPIYKSSGNYICQGEATLELQNDTPDVCEASYKEEPPTDDGVGGFYEASSAVAVEAKKVGTCKVTATVKGPDMPPSVSLEKDVKKKE